MNFKKNDPRYKMQTIATDNIFAIIGRGEVEWLKKTYPGDFTDLAFISISAPENKSIKTKYIGDSGFNRNHFPTSLKLKFFDGENTADEAQSKLIRKFIQKNKDKKFLINCEAGVSRSATIGLAVEYLLNGIEPEDSVITKYYRYTINQTLFDRIIKRDS